MSMYVVRFDDGLEHSAWHLVDDAFRQRIALMRLGFKGIWVESCPNMHQPDGHYFTSPLQVFVDTHKAISLKK